MGEMRRETYKTFTGQLSTTILLLFFLITTNLQKFACGAGVLECNGTMNIGECLADGDEFFMESETSTKLLAGGGKEPLDYKALQKPTICKAPIYGSCIGAQANVKSRSCDWDNRCKHDLSKN
ncbi:uncharacterized protein LOC132624736 [Lycium barbarum]|uniref:uncharacterized protein LOC132624736 n=1 Tax=Lycium barbarum TaxID=112863 RepID=UPI00293EF2B0|nr:uncharacterized protein LOC132624736 [Lycium barbarum]